MGNATLKERYDGVKFYGKNDLGNAWQLEKAEPILNAFTLDKQYTDINEIIELYNIRNAINSDLALKGWTQEQCKKYKKTVDMFLSVIGKFFSQINDSNFIEIVSTVSVLYMDDFWELFVQFNMFNRISPNIFETYLQSPNITLSKILEHKKLVYRYGAQLAEALRTSDETVRILTSVYLEKSKSHYFIPKEFSPKEVESVFLKHTESEQVNPNVLELIYKGQSTKECPISDKLRLKAKRALEQFWSNRKETITTTGYGISVSFAKQEKTKEEKRDGSTWHLTYDIDWLENNLDYPTILNNFLYLFEMFDIWFRSSLVSVQSEISVFEMNFMPRGAKFYPKGMGFNMKNMTSAAQTALYYDFLKSHNIDLEEVFKWFFETYLPEEFDVHGFSMVASAPSATYVEKCRSLASEMDGVLKQFRMFVEDGKIDRELFEMSSEHMIIGNIPSLIPNKYAYPSSKEINNEMWALFSDQSVLSYTEKTNSKYDTFCQLLSHEKVCLSDFAEWQKNYIQWLNERDVISISVDGSIELHPDKAWVLQDLYQNDVTCIYTPPFSFEALSSVIEEMISAGDLRVGSTLFTEPERDYLNYMLNKSEFSDGLDLRNKYIHSTYPQDEEEKKKDYITLLKLMILVITKINDEFCTFYSQKDEP